MRIAANTNDLDFFAVVVVFETFNHIKEEDSKKKISNLSTKSVDEFFN